MEGQIIPAVLVKNFTQLEEGISKARKISKRVQIDICDEDFTSSKTWPFVEMTKLQFIAIGNQQDADVFLPFWEEVEFSADLMTEDPLQYVDSLMRYGFDDVVVHFRSLPEENRQAYFQEIVSKCSEYEISLNLAVDLKANFDKVKEFLQTNSGFLNYVQVMGIREIGKQGEQFDEGSLVLMSNLKIFFIENKIDLPIFVDGGMNEKSIVKCKDAGAEVFVVGSALGKAIDYKEEFDYLNSL